MSYNTKNYTEQGGERTVIGGTLVFGEGVKFEGAGLLDNIVADTGNASKNAAMIEAILLGLKKAGIMEGDAWSPSIPTGITYSGMATEATATNSNAVEVTLEDGVITVAVGGKIEDKLTEADHGSTWGKHYWLGFGIRTGMATDAGITFKQTSGSANPTVATLTADDDAEAHSVGLAEGGDIILYIKAEVVRDNSFEFELSLDGYKTQKYSVVIDETAAG